MPGSPAGTEYQLPVERAREEARAGTSGSAGSGATGARAAVRRGRRGSESARATERGRVPRSGATYGDPATTTTVERDEQTSAEQTVPRAGAAHPTAPVERPSRSGAAQAAYCCSVVWQGWPGDAEL